MAQGNVQGTADVTLSLREISRRLAIPPSTVVYYKDLYGKFLPVAVGRGRRKRYPSSALEIFRGIREMYDLNMKAEQIELELAHRFGAHLAGTAGEIGGLSARSASGSVRDSEISRTLGAVLDKVTGVQERQTAYRIEIGALRGEIAELKAELARREQAHDEALSAAAAQADALRREKERLEQYVRRRIEKDNPLHSRPSPAFLGLPLVICSERGEFLGVGGKGRGHFTPQNLLSLIQSSQRSGRTVELLWDRDHDHWILRVCAREAEREQNIVFMLRRTLTPSSNLVAQLVHMVIDGHEVPEPFLLSLFRQIKESFNA